MVGKQAQAFLLGEADAWHQRNKDKPRVNDPVLQAIDRLEIVPKNILEVGCGTGWRLDKLVERYNCWCCGIEPSEKALGIDSMWQMVSRGRVTLARGTATGPYPTARDLIIFGFCLYLVDREDLFKVVYESDRALVDGGYIIIHDFHAFAPFSRIYEHAPEIASYHMDNSRLWLGHPHYRLIRNTFFGADCDTAVTVLQKCTGGAFPLE